MAKTHDLIVAPVKTAKPKVWEYTPEQLQKIEQLREYALSLLLPESDPYRPNEQKWIEERSTIPRYMRASKWKLEEGKTRIKGTLEWRREFKPDLISADDVKIEAETGKIILNGFDHDGRPIIYMRPGRENTHQSPRQIRHLIFCLERAIDMMPPGQESMAIIVDYKTTTLSTNPSLAVARKVLNILQQHYVERLGRAIVVNLPFILNFFYKGLSPFFDPITRDKIRFNPNLLDLIPASQLDKDFAGGKLEYEFKFDVYWEQICRNCGVSGDGTRYVPERLMGVEQQSESASTSSSDSGSEATTVAGTPIDLMAERKLPEVMGLGLIFEPPCAKVTELVA
jgi:hypothetical protein